MEHVKEQIYRVTVEELKARGRFTERDTFRFRCPVCGDTEKHVREHRYDGSFNQTLGVGQCFSCGARFVKENEKPFIPHTRPSTSRSTLSPRSVKSNLPEKLRVYLHERGISLETAERLHVGWKELTNRNGELEPFLAFPFYDNGNVVNVQYKSTSKEFRMEQGRRLLPWNIDAALTGDTVYLTEGMMDALALVECGLESVVSLPNGCGTKMGVFDAYRKTHFEGKHIVYCGDMDEAGLEKRAEVARYFQDEEVLVVDWTAKDANDVLMAGGTEAVLACIEAARRLPLEHVATVDTAMEQLRQLTEQGVPRPPGIKLHGFTHLIRFETGRLMVISGYPGAGKSSFADFIMMSLAVEQGWKAAVYSPEKYPLELHYYELGQLLMGREMTTKNFPPRALERGVDWLRRHVFHITDDCSQIEDILATASQLVRREQVRVLLLDPFNYIDLPVLSGANDTQKISHVLRNIVEFAHRHNVLVILVAHPKKPQDERHKGRVGDMPSLYDIAGSADFYNKCDYGVIVQRSNALTFVHVLKVRFRHLGQLGVRAFTYSAASGRFSGTDEVRSPSSGEVIQYTPLPHDESDWTTERWSETSVW